MTTLLMPMGPIDFPWWFVAAVIVFWFGAVALPPAAPLAIAGVLLARKRGWSTKRCGLGGFALGGVLAVATYWATDTFGSISFDGSFLLCWLPGLLLAVVVAFIARHHEPRAV